MELGDLGAGDGPTTFLYLVFLFSEAQLEPQPRSLGRPAERLMFAYICYVPSLAGAESLKTASPG